MKILTLLTMEFSVALAAIYPWGSGGNVPQRSKAFLDYVAEMRKAGMSEVEIARGLSTEEHPFTTTDLRALKTIAKNESKTADIAMAQRLKDKGMSNGAIAERMGLSGESQVRSLLKPGEQDKLDVLHTTANMLRDQVEQKGIIDVGTGVERNLGIARTKLDTAVAMLKEEGYSVHNGIKIDQLGTGHQTELKVLAPSGMSWGDVMRRRDEIRQINEHSEDGGRSFFGLHEPMNFDSKRLAIRYAEDGGTEADGVMYVRPGVDDLSLGGSRYAQVRVAVDGTHYIKGMAIYKDDLPDGVDIMFNTNKSDKGDKLAALKPLKRTMADGDDPNKPDTWTGPVDKDNPFGAVIKPGGQIVRGGKTTSVMNRVNEEGDWDGWSRNLSSQMLSKQSPKLVKEQLAMTKERRKSELDEIMALTNPAVRKKLLESYADDVDSAAVHLKAAALPRQRSQVIMPVSKVKDTEIYAPNFRDGEQVVLVRYPHGGIFEIPELTVNNRNPAAKRLLGNAKDAVGINSKVAERLSGADFDGDTVLVIPNSRGKVKTAPALEGLKNFDPQRQYKAYEGMSRMSARTKQLEMGKVSNLITDMTIRGASADELARAVRHSMVVIDAEKHNLDYRRSERENGIANLKKKYQASDTGGQGASTIISRASSEIRVNERRARRAADGGPIDKATGKRVYTETGATYTNKDGKVVRRTMKSTKLAEADDAHTLSSGTVVEKLYADHSNALKSLANQARKESVNTKTIPYSPSAKATYANEVASLERKLNVALMNAPRERQAQILANTVVKAKRQANPNLDNAEVKKIKSQALNEARARTGAGKTKVEIGWDEWNAIQAGAISNNKLTQILSNSDLDRVKQLATPKTKVLMSSAKQQRAQSMMALGYTQQEVADALGVSLTTLKTSLSEGGS